MFGAVGNEQIGNKKGNQIHEAIVSKLEGSYLKKGRAEIVWNMLPELNQSIHVHTLSRRFGNGTGRSVDTAFPCSLIRLPRLI